MAVKYTKQTNNPYSTVIESVYYYEALQKENIKFLEILLL